MISDMILKIINYMHWIYYNMGYTYVFYFYTNNMNILFWGYKNRSWGYSMNVLLFNPVAYTNYNKKEITITE